jgi:hypothetical protein
VNCQLGARIVLLEGCSKAIIEIRFEAFTRSDGGDMRNGGLSLREDGSSTWYASVMSEPVLV